MDKENVFARSMLGIGYANIGEEDKAIKEWEITLKKGPDNLVALDGLINLYSKENKVYRLRKVVKSKLSVVIDKLKEDLNKEDRAYLVAEQDRLTGLRKRLDTQISQKQKVSTFKKVVSKAEYDAAEIAARNNGEKFSSSNYKVVDDDKLESERKKQIRKLIESYGKDKNAVTRALQLMVEYNINDPELLKLATEKQPSMKSPDTGAPHREINFPISGSASSTAVMISSRKTIKMRNRIRRLPQCLEALRVRRDWTDRFATVLPDDAEALLKTMYAGAAQAGADGNLHAIDSVTRISREQGMLLYHLCLERKPKVVLETGLAYGFSTVFLLSALREIGRGRHIAIDHLQSSLWQGVGTQRGLQLGVEDRFSVIEERAEQVLPQLAAERLRVQFVYIDGDHRFDGVMLDFTLAARLCGVGAVIVFDDLWMPSMRCLARYIKANRRDWRRIPSPHANFCILEKIGTDEREWDHFVGF
jgi:predicted O-methyltransferase YrrM